MASDEVCCGDEVRRADGGLAKAEMALGQTAGFFGVIDEISLAVEVRGMTDNLDGVLVGTHGTVGTHAPELGAGLAGGSGLNLLRQRQRGVSHIVHDADGEVVLGYVLLEIVEHR